MTAKTDKPKTEVAPRIAVAIKTFGNNKTLEGLRVKAGQRFAIDAPAAGLPVMRQARFMQLKNAGLLRELGDADLKSAPGAASFRAHVQYAHQGEAAEANRRADAAPDGGKKTGRRVATKAPAAAGETPPAGPKVRRASKKRTQTPEPPAPSRITGPANPIGSQTGGDTPASSSPAGRPVTSSSFQKRGNRRG